MQEILAYLDGHRWVAETFAIVLATGVIRLIAKQLFDRIARQIEKTNNLYDSITS